MTCNVDFWDELGLRSKYEGKGQGRLGLFGALL
jgi:hypothetical protein